MLPVYITYFQDGRSNGGLFGFSIAAGELACSARGRGSSRASQRCRGCCRTAGPCRRLPRPSGCSVLSGRLLSVALDHVDGDGDRQQRTAVALVAHRRRPAGSPRRQWRAAPRRWCRIPSPRRNRCPRSCRRARERPPEARRCSARTVRRRRRYWSGSRADLGGDSQILGAAPFSAAAPVDVSGIPQMSV